MLKEQGNLLEENIKITKELLDFAKANDYKICVKTGNFSKFGLPKVKRSVKYCNIVDELFELYITGDLYPPDYYEVFNLRDSNMIMHIFRMRGHNLKGISVLDLYAERRNSKTKQTCLSKYQVQNVSQCKHIKETKEQTTLKNLGVKNPSFSDEVKRKRVETMQFRYGVTNIKQNEHFIRKSQKSKASNDPRYAKILEIRDGKIQDPNEIIQIASAFCATQELNYLKEFGIKEPTKFTTELKLAGLLDSLNVKYIKNAKKIHGVKKNSRWHDLDAYLPDYNLGIEINGLAYHSTNVAAKGEPKESDYHFNKFISFYNKGIKLLSFTDYEQQHFSADVQNIVEFHLGLSDSNAPKVSKEFLDFNEIQDISESLNYGCFDPLKLSQAKLRGRMIEGFVYFDCGVLL